MKKLTLIIVIVGFLLFSCKEKKSVSNNLLTDKIWLSNMNDAQYYLSSKDNRFYTWLTVENRVDGEYMPFSIAKGTPESNPFPKVFSTYKEGWSAMQYFKIKGDTLIFQNEEDINGNNISKYHISTGKDTTIGILEYKTLIVTNSYGQRVWKTKKIN